MHELSVSSAIVDTAIRHAAGRPVTVVSVRIGSLRQVVADSLAFYFEIVSRDTLADGAELEIEHVTALMQCRVCDHEWDPAPPPLEIDAEVPLAAGAGMPVLPVFRCPACEASGARVLRGDELEVESIEVSDSARAPAHGAAH